MEEIKRKWQQLATEKKQNIFGIIFISIFTLLSVAIVLHIKGGDNNKKIEDNRSNFDALQETRSNVEDVWLHESRDDLKSLQDQLKEKDLTIKSLNSKYEELALKLDKIEIKEEENEELWNEIANLEQKLLEQKQAIQSQSSNQVTNNQSPNPSNLPNYQFNGNDPFSSASNSYNNQNTESQVPDSRGIMILDFEEENPTNSFDINQYLPAGSYVKAVLISAVDASVGISAQSNPRQVLFRIIGKAKTAIDRKQEEQLEVDIDGCTVTGAATGDLSSERAYVRLLKMTCYDNQENVIESEVEGYAADGSDGKSGISGQVVSREGDFITKSFLAGVVSGMGNGLNTKFQPRVRFSDGFATANDISNRDVLGQGLAEGISVTSKNVSDYLIKRAEQYQPVISVASGKEVELVFVSGTYLDGRVNLPGSQQNQSEKKSTLY